MQKLLAIAIGFLSLTACAQENSKGGEVAPDEAQKMMNKEDVVMLDVRTPEEYETGHIENARHIDYYSDDFKERVAELDKDKTYVVYCRSGSRSGKSQMIMEKMGFENVHNLKGGIVEWHEQNKPLTKE